MKAVFVGACARSGTTFLGSMLGTHSACIATPESKFTVDLYRELMSRSPDLDVGAILAQVKRRQDFKKWGVKVDFPADSEAVPIAGYPDLIKWLVRVYASQSGKPDYAFWIDHTPSNIVYASLLLDLFPEAKLIHLIRDGRAVAASVMQLEWGPNTPHAAAYWWINRVAHGLAVESSFGSDRVMRVRYEDLVLDPHSTLQGLCDFLQVEYEPNMVTGTGFRVPKQIAAIHPYVGTAPNTSRIYAWQNRLTQRQIEIFEAIAGQFLLCFGYELVASPNARAAQGLELLSLGIQEFFWARIANRFRSRIPGRRAILPPRQGNAIPA